MVVAIDSEVIRKADSVFPEIVQCLKLFALGQHTTLHSVFDQKNFENRQPIDENRQNRRTSKHRCSNPNRIRMG